VIYHIFLQHKV